MKQSFQLICVLLALCSQANAQNCKVLLPALAGSYEGDCKNDKANGMGKAIGTDTYQGTFKNGYPEGQGKYTWRNGDWYEGNFKSGLRNGEGTLHFLTANNTDSSKKGFWTKDVYTGIYEVPFKVESMSFMVKSAVVRFDSKQEPAQITISLSSVTGGSVDVHGTVPKPVLTGIEIRKGSFLNRSEVTTMDKKNIYYLRDVIYPFSATFRIGGDDVVIDFNNAGCWIVDIVLRQ